MKKKKSWKRRAFQFLIPKIIIPQSLWYFLTKYFYEYDFLYGDSDDEHDGGGDGDGNYEDEDYELYLDDDDDDENDTTAIDDPILPPLTPTDRELFEQNYETIISRYAYTKLVLPPVSSLFCCVCLFVCLFIVCCLFEGGDFLLLLLYNPL